ncbi:hypothetical protein Y032_0143g2365 [Ancylostoma ceylanicum]|uniref:Uncharacterized protein n=1 Tax=Ancylostoma ceylanicum TaxID=53326 RepID=A0A016T322_9BILA|nr:hypothetical protein Y032_0143g2365 [Ancylostoma ceylanicum]
MRDSDAVILVTQTEVSCERAPGKIVRADHDSRASGPRQSCERTTTIVRVGHDMAASRSAEARSHGTSVREGMCTRLTRLIGARPLCLEALVKMMLL